MNCRIIMTLLPLLLSASVVARTDGVDDYIKGQMQKRHIAGLSLAVIRDGKVVKVKGYGLANVETNTPCTPETVYKIGSISKQFLATGILTLVKDGKLNLEDKISQYLDGTPDIWKDITIRHLLTHTSGLVEDPPGFEPYKMQADTDILRMAYQTPLLFSPGEKFSYSNLGYFALGEVIHKVSGKPWSVFLTERLFVPVGMIATHVTTTTYIIPHRASGYNWNRDHLENAENWVAVRPSGAFLSNVGDMAKWDISLLSDSILSSSMREQMWTPTTLNNGTTSSYGFGWDLAPWQGHKRESHTGALPGFLSAIERFPDDKLTVIVLTNTTSADPQKIALNVCGFYIPALTPTVLKPIPDSEPEITAKVKSMISGFVSGNLDMDLFIPDLVSWLNKEGKEGMSNTFQSRGTIQDIVLVERVSEGDNRTYRYRLTYRDTNLLFQCTFNKDGKITGFGIQEE